MAIAVMGSTPEMSVWGFVVVVACVFGVFALMKGVLRILLASVMLAASLFVGYWVWMETPDFGSRMMANPPLWVSAILPAVAAAVTYALLQKILRFVLRPFGNSGVAPTSFAGRLFSVIFSFVPTSLICVAVAVAVRHVSAMQEIKNPTQNHVATLWKKTIDEHIPPAWLQRLDPLTDPERITLAKLVAMASEEHIPRAIPVTEEAYMQEKVLADPHLRELGKDKKFSEILRDPSVERALADPRVQKVIAEFMGKGL